MIGLQIAKKDIEEKNLQYDSTKPRLQIAVDRDPSHLGLIDVKGTALVSAVGNGYYAEETLFTVNHRLGYKPKVLIYYFDYVFGFYSVGKFFYNFGAFDDYLGFEVDEQNLYVKHILDDTITNIGTTSVAPSTGKVRVKYLILSNPVNAYTNGRPV